MCFKFSRIYFFVGKLKNPISLCQIISEPTYFKSNRNPSGIDLPRYKNSFSPDAISSRNNIITNFPSIPSFNELKTRTLSFIRPKTRELLFCGAHDLLGVRYLFQLRVNLSPKGLFCLYGR